MNIVVPLAGIDKAFEEKFSLPKAFAPLNGMPIIQHIAHSRPFSYSGAIFILLAQQDEKYSMADKLHSLFGRRIHVVLAPKPTQGAPQSVLLAKHLINTDEPLLIDLMDQYLDLPGYMDFVSSTNAQGVIASFESSYWNRGYMLYDAKGRVRHVSEKDKTPISTHSTACISYFRHGRDFVQAAERMVKRKRVAANGAYLVSLAYNELIEGGKQVLPFPCEFVGTLGTLEGAAAFPQLARPLKSAQEILSSTILSSQVFAHRGDFSRFPENSLPAIKAALMQGYSCEIDARFSRDNVPVLSHDARTGRMFEKDLKISESTLKELCSIRHKGSKTAIATLQEALDALASISICSFAVHLKEIPTQQQAREISSLILARNLENRVFFFGNDQFCMPALSAMKSASSQMHAGWHASAPAKLAQDWQLANAQVLWIDETEENAMDGKSLKIAKEQSKTAIAMSPELLDEALGRKIKTSPNAAQARWKQLLLAGYGAICTDYPHELAAFLGI